jgi:hypothetical protein
MKHGIITYLPLDLDISSSDLETFSQEISRADNSSWFWSPYRSCWMLPLYTGGSEVERFQINDHQKSFGWTSAVEGTTHLRTFLEEQVFPWMSPPGRIVILKTPPKQTIKLHTDCSYTTRDQLQYKFRIVLKGERNNLWFLGADKQRHFIDGKHPCYVLDGSHPHGMENTGEDEKLTLCVGAPWGDFHFTPFVDLLKRSIKIYESSLILRDSIGRPDDESIFQREYGEISN